MNTLAKTLLTGALSSVTAFAGAEGIRANVTLASDYTFRGVSQTDNQMALQGGFDWAHASDVYVGAWASNVDSDFFGGAKDPQLETNLYAGYATALGAFTYDFGILVYFYPGADAPAADDLRTVEFYVSGGYALTKAFALNAKLYYADELNFAGNHGDGLYLIVGADYALLDNLSLSAAVGHSSGGAFETFGGPAGPDSYMDYRIGVSTTFAGANLALSWIDSNDDAEALFGDSVTDGRVVFTLSKSF
ncbi:MAG: TorF family putative porin [Gammaproteobacteria bacterium]|nr:TorF family putative porin [Gammaproteobacteria bacterium]